MNLQLDLKLMQAVLPQSQADLIIEYLSESPGRRIDTWTAIEKFHCTCLTQRIFDIKTKFEFAKIREQYNIKSETACRKGKHFTEYWFELKNYCEE